MLTKLLKYDLKKSYKYLSAFYIAIIFFAILARCLSGIGGSWILDFIKGFVTGGAIGIMIGTIINNLMNLGIRFKATLYEDESYLIHTLPVDKHVHYLEKVVLSIVTTLTSILVVFLGLFILYYSKENIEFLKMSLLSVANLYNSSIWGLITLFLLVFAVEYLNMIQATYTGIILGHKMNNNKIRYSVIFAFTAYMITQLIVLLVAFIIALFNKDLLNLFITQEIINMEMVKLIGFISIGIYLVIFIINLIVNIKVFKKGVNVN